MAAEFLNGGDHRESLVAKGKTDSCPPWVNVRDNPPSAAPDRRRVPFPASRDRSGDHADEHLRSSTGILQADANVGYNRLGT